MLKMKPLKSPAPSTFVEKIFGDISWIPNNDSPDVIATSLTIEAETQVIEAPLPLMKTAVPEVECMTIFAIDLPSKMPGLYHTDFVPESEAEVMLKKMIMALNLNEELWRIWVCEQHDGPVDKAQMPAFHALINQFPKVKIYSFGVRILEFLLGHKLRVSEVIGQNFTSLIGVSFTPLFHPDYLLINPAMKKRVWEALTRPMPPV